MAGAVGVPEMTPVVVLKFNPAGNVGLMEYVEGLPPVCEGLLSVMTVPTVYDAGLDE